MGRLLTEVSHAFVFPFAYYETIVMVCGIQLKANFGN